MVTFHDLDWDIFENIVACGCDDELNTPLFKQHTRRRKEFAATIRAVCKKWRDYIDGTAGAHKNFWIARARLDRPSEIPLFRQFVRFQNIISHSEGCDLTIGFYFNSEEDLWKEEVVDLPPESEELVLLKLFIHGMNNIIPHQKQIIFLYFRSESLQACKHFIEVLTKMTSVPRLTRMMLLYSASRDLSLSGFQRAAAVSGWTPLISRRQDPPTPPFYIPSLSTCKELTISHPTWLNELEYSPVPIAQEIELYSVQPFNSSFVQAIYKHPFLQSSLVSLGIGDLSAEREPVPESSTGPFPHLSFPRLRSFFLQVTLPVSRLENFLGQSTFPCLQRATLWLSTIIDSVEPIPAEVTSPYSLHMPRLRSLDLTIDLSWSVLRILDLFSRTSTEELIIEVQEDAPKVDGGQVIIFNHHLRNILSCFESPMKLDLDLPTYTYLHLFLDSLNFDSVNNLHIRFRDENILH